MVLVAHEATSDELRAVAVSTSLWLMFLDSHRVLGGFLHVIGRLATIVA